MHDRDTVLDRNKVSLASFLTTYRRTCSQRRASPAIFASARIRRLDSPTSMGADSSTLRRRTMAGFTIHISWICWWSYPL